MWEPSRNSFGLATTTSSKQRSLADFVTSVDRAPPAAAGSAADPAAAAKDEAGPAPVATALGSPSDAAAPLTPAGGPGTDIGVAGGGVGDSAAVHQSPTVIGTPFWGGSGGTDPGTAASGSAVDAMLQRKRSRELASDFGESTPMVIDGDDDAGGGGGEPIAADGATDGATDGERAAKAARLDPGDDEDGILDAEEDLSCDHRAACHCSAGFASFVSKRSGLARSQRERGPPARRTAKRTSYVCLVRGCIKYKLEMGNFPALKIHYKHKHPRREAPV